MVASNPPPKPSAPTAGPGAPVAAVRGVEAPRSGSWPSSSPSRFRLPKECKAVFEQIYTVEKTPDTATRAALAAQFNVTARQVQVWFQNKRQRAAKRMSPGTQQNDTSLRTLAATCAGVGTSDSSWHVSPTIRQSELIQGSTHARPHQSQPSGGSAVQTEHALATTFAQRRNGSTDSLADLAFVASRVEDLDKLSRASSLGDITSLSRIGSLADLASLCRDIHTDTS